MKIVLYDISGIVTSKLITSTQSCCEPEGVTSVDSRDNECLVSMTDSTDLDFVPGSSPMGRLFV